MIVPVKCVKEEKPGVKWQENFHATWPFYKKWFLSEGHFARKGYLESSEKLRDYMPELFPIYEELTELAGGDDLAARYLSMYCPPPYLSGCTQLAYLDYNTTALIRNYDYNSKLFEGTMLYTNWLQPIIGMQDCSWGLLDGINASGLSASLTFGGRKIIGTGFGIPLIMRYVLETCTNVAEAIEKFKTIPVHMSYNVTLVDNNHDYATVYLSPDREIIITKDKTVTNHQKKIEWEEYAEITGTQQRLDHLNNYLNTPYITEQSLINLFLQPPLYCHNIEKDFTTLYTAVYKPIEKTVAVYLEGKTIFQSFTNFIENSDEANLSEVLNYKY